MAPIRFKNKKPRPNGASTRPVGGGKSSSGIRSKALEKEKRRKAYLEKRRKLKEKREKTRREQDARKEQLKKAEEELKKAESSEDEELKKQAEELKKKVDELKKQVEEDEASWNNLEVEFMDLDKEEAEIDAMDIDDEQVDGEHAKTEETETVLVSIEEPDEIMSEDDGGYGEPLYTRGQSTNANGIHMEVKGWLRSGYAKHYIVQYGPNNAAKYKLEPSSEVSLDYAEPPEEDVGDPENRNGEKKVNKKPIYTKRHVSDIYGVVWKCPPGLDDEEELDLINPETERKRYPNTYVLILWEKDETKELKWETRTALRSRWGPDNADKAIFEAAEVQYGRHGEYLSKTRRSLSRGPTPGVGAQWARKGREKSLGKERSRSSRPKSHRSETEEEERRPKKKKAGHNSRRERSGSSRSKSHSSNSSRASSSEEAGHNSGASSSEGAYETEEDKEWNPKKKKAGHNTRSTQKKGASESDRKNGLREFKKDYCELHEVSMEKLTPSESAAMVKAWKQYQVIHDLS